MAGKDVRTMSYKVLKMDPKASVVANSSTLSLKAQADTRVQKLELEFAPTEVRCITMGFSKR